jgi:phenylalanyl-tRNA synthetase beta chain
MDPDAMEIKESGSEFIAKGISLSMRNKEIVSFGSVKQALLKEFDIENPVFYADINWTMVIKNYDKKITEFHPIPRFPEVRRDLSMVLERKVQFEEIRKIAYRSESRLLKNLRIFDVYEGDKIDQGKKSYALSFILQDEDKTLTDKQIDKIMSNIAIALTEELGAQIRS